jgi:hypothetical protein
MLVEPKFLYNPKRQMSLRNFLIVILFFKIVYADVFAQSSLKSWNRSDIELANSAKNEPELTEEEKNVIFYTNLVRINPSLFSETVLTHYLDSLKIKDDQWIASLKKELKSTKKMSILYFRKDLFTMAKTHAIGMGKSGKIGHTNPRGKNFQQRAKEAVLIYNGVYENCQYGYNDGLSIVIDLLIDEGINNLGHRKTILNPELQYIAPSIQPHKKYNYNCVIEYGGALNQ